MLCRQCRVCRWGNGKRLPAFFRGFTLVELLVVIAVIGVLIALLLPAVQAARATAQRMQCSSHLKQLGLAVMQYEQTHRVLPPSWTKIKAGEENPKYHNLLTFLLPYLEQQTVFQQYDWNLRWNDAANKRAIDVNIPVFLCPSAPGDRDSAADYAASERILSTAWKPLVESGQLIERREWLGVFQASTDGVTRWINVSDGLSNTFLLLEDGGRPLRYRDGSPDPSKYDVSGARWADPDASFYIVEVCHGNSMVNCTNNNEIYSFHSGGCNFLYCDGSVHFHSEGIVPDTFVSLYTRAASDIVQQFP
jgi:prepilin-type N-terminal cleavage/methylation domain-containing protein/prepilin-type processing-associated H-X9-DG protein